MERARLKSFWLSSHEAYCAGVVRNQYQNSINLAEICCTHVTQLCGGVHSSLLFQLLCHVLYQSSAALHGGLQAGRNACIVKLLHHAFPQNPCTCLTYDLDLHYHAVYDLVLHLHEKFWTQGRAGDGQLLHKL